LFFFNTNKLKKLNVLTVTPHLNNNIVKWNITQNNIKSQNAEYKIAP